jgi:hypothetical protein
MLAWRRLSISWRYPEIDQHLFLERLLFLCILLIVYHKLELDLHYILIEIRNDDYVFEVEVKLN